MFWEGYSEIRQLEKLGDGWVGGGGVGLVGGQFLLILRIGRANQYCFLPDVEVGVYLKLKSA